VAWLRLMVGHFDAVEILVRHVTSPIFPYKSISIDILVAPPTNSALLPWSQLFTSYKFLPKTGAIKPLSAITNDQIHNFLKEGISTASKVKDALDQVRNALKRWDAGPEPECRKTSRLLQPLAMSTNDIVREKAAVIITKIEGWKQCCGSDNNRVEISNEIKALHDALGELSDSNRFFLNLNNSLFIGTLHCEACLASLLPAFTRGIPTDDSKYKRIKILPNMQVEYPLSHLFLSSDPYFGFL